LVRNQKNRETENAALEATTQKRASKLDPYKDIIQGLLEKHADITNERVYEIIQGKGYQGKITTLRDFLVEVRGKKAGEPIFCVETAPGQRGSHDWSEYNISYTQDGVREKTIFFSFILNYSRRQYIELVDDKTQMTLLNCLINTFVYLDGVTQEIKSDNQKTCVDKWELGKPVFNKTFLEFATHYHFAPLTIHPGKPRENLKIERPFYYLETNFLNGRTFKNKQDLAQQLQQWLLYYNDTRTHRTTMQRPIDLYQKEMPYLQPLPRVHYDTGQFAYRVVNNESAIEWNGYFYMVPRGYLHETCPVRATSTELIIYSPQFAKLKQYTLAPKGSNDKYIGRHKNESGTATSPNPLELIERLDTLGTIVQGYVRELKAHRPSDYPNHLQHILSLKVQYYTDDLIIAIRRASEYKIYDASSIENFLSVNAQKKNEVNIPPKPY